MKVIGAPRLWTLTLALMLMQLVVVAVGHREVNGQWVGSSMVTMAVETLMHVDALVGD